MNKKLLEILACPVCKAPLDYFDSQSALVCRAERLSFPVRDDIPLLLADEAQQLSSEQLEEWERLRRQEGA